MYTSDIVKCNGQWFSSIEDGVIEVRPESCPTCRREEYRARNLGRQALNAREICEPCHSLFDRFDEWCQRKPASQPNAVYYSNYSMARNPLCGLDENCSSCQVFSRHCRPIKDGSTSHNLIFTSLGINILDTPYRFTTAFEPMVYYKPRVLWAKIRYWLSSCEMESNHEPSEMQVSALQSINIWLIDVDDRRLVQMSQAEDQIYAAASYVWGGATQPMLNSTNLAEVQKFGYFDLPGSCSQTIRDAIYVCRRTCVRYLWVDALCIQQDAPSDQLQRQITNMDSIYANASFTIVAADSETAHEGIHGVSIPRPPPQTFKHLGVEEDSIEIAYFCLNASSVEDLVNSTKWATRAWTYQEAILSKRLLVFTRSLCALICPCGVERDDGLIDFAENGDHDEFTKPIHFLRDNMPHTTRREAIYEAISTICGRSLTDAQDIIKAFSGIMTVMSERHGQFKYGMPLSDINVALTWKHHNMDFFPTASMRTYGHHSLSSHSGQRDGFPSWSWAGWLHSPGAMLHFTRRKMIAKSIIRGVNELGKLEEARKLSHKDPPAAEDEPVDPGSLVFELPDEEIERTERLIKGLNISPDFVLVLKTIVLRIRIPRCPLQVTGDFSIYVHNFEEAKRPLREGESPLDDPFRFVIYIKKEWRDSQGDELEFAVIGADTSDPMALHLETIIIGRSGKLCYREGASDICYKVSKGTTQERLDWLIQEGSVETIVLC